MVGTEGVSLGETQADTGGPSSSAQLRERRKVRATDPRFAPETSTVVILLAGCLSWLNKRVRWSGRKQPICWKF